MTPIDNRSALPHAWVEKTAPDGASVDVLVLRGTFDFAAGGRPVGRAVDQAPVLYGDEFDGPAERDPLKAVLRREGNVVFHKPAADVTLTGTACAEDGTPRRGWLAALQVGARRKVLQLHGPRQFTRQFGGWRLGQADEVDRVLLDYRLAFGGCFATPATPDAAPEFVYKPDNPAGCGWLPDKAALQALGDAARRQVEADIARLKHLHAPQIEAHQQPVRDPHDAHPAQGFAPLARWCEPRLRFAGTYDEAWRARRYPLLPADFDLRFYHSAHPDLIWPGYLRGDEPIALLGLLPEGVAHMRLPGLLALASVTRASGAREQGRLQIDTLSIDLDARQLTLVWRGTFDRADPVRAVALGTMELGARMGAAHG